MCLCLLLTVFPAALAVPGDPGDGFPDGEGYEAP